VAFLLGAVLHLTHCPGLFAIMSVNVAGLQKQQI